MKITLIFGPPGSGKGTQSEKLMELGYKHISSGDLFRNEIKNESKIGLEIKELIAKGNLVTDEIVNEMVFSNLKKLENEENVLLDGYPRTIAQMDELYKNFGIFQIINLTCSDEVLIKRISLRMVCPNCGYSYHPITKKPKIEGICDNCGHKLIHRDDDNEESVKKRLNEYNNKTLPIIKEAKKLRIKIIELDGEMTINDTWKELKKQL